MSAVCVDASLVVKWLVDEEESEPALDILEGWTCDQKLLRVLGGKLPWVRGLGEPTRETTVR